MSVKEINMTVGNPLRKMLVFAIPIMAGGMLQQMYNMTDAVIAGRAIGSEALAAVANSFYIVFVITILFIGIGQGASIVISQTYGAGDMKRIRTAVDAATMLIIVGGLTCTVVGITLAEPLLRLLATPPELMGLSVSYLRIIFLGALASLGYAIAAALLNAVGNSRTPLVLLGVSSVLNIILDLLFILVLHLGTNGLALATIIAQGVSLAGCIVYLNKSGSVISLRLRGFEFNPHMMLLIIRLGVPTGVQNALMVISMMVLQRQINEFGVAVMAGRAIESRLESFMLIPLGSIATAVTTFVGQNTGAGGGKRVLQGLKCGFLMAAAMSLFFCVVFFLFGKPILSLFSTNQSALFEAQRCISIVAPSFIVYSLATIWQGFFRGVGDTIFPLIVSLSTQFAYRIVAIGPFLKIWPTPSGIWYLYVSSWGLMFLLNCAYYKTGYWKKYEKLIRNT